MFFKIIRAILGPILLFCDFISRPRKMKRSEAAQQKVDKLTEGLALYEFSTCPFCIKVRREIRRLNLTIPLCDARNDDKSRAELIEGTKKTKVPCLRIEENGAVRWMLESKDIKAYLNQSFGDIK